MSAFRLTVRYRAVVVPSSHPAAAPKHCSGAELPLDFAEQLQSAPDRVYVVPLFAASPTFSSTQSLATQALPLSLDSHVDSSALLEPFTWPFQPTLEAAPIRLGRDPTPRCRVPSSTSDQAVALLPHAYASREHLQLYVKPITFGYNRNAEMLAVALKQVGKNPTLVDGIVLRHGEEKAVKLFAAGGAEHLATLEQVRRAEQQGAGHVPAWWAGDAHLVAPVRLLVAARLSFPQEFAAKLPVVLLVAEVVTPVHDHRVTGGPASPLGAAAAATQLVAADSDDTQDEPSPPSRRAPVDRAARHMSAAERGRLLADASALDEELFAAPPPRRHRPEQQESVAGFRMLSSDDDDSDKPRDNSAFVRQFTAVDSGPAPRAPVPPAPSKLAGWAAAVEAAQGGAPSPSMFRAESRAKPRKPTASGTPPVRLASDDDVPLIVPRAAHLPLVKESPARRTPTATTAAAPTTEPSKRVASSLIQVASSDDLLVLPRAKPSPQHSSTADAPLVVWQWKARRHTEDTDPTTWASYSPAESRAIESAFQRGETSHKLNSNFEIDFKSPGGHRQVSRAVDPPTYRAVRRLTGESAKAVARNADPDRRVDTAAGKWMWNSNTHVPDHSPNAWAPYGAGDQAVLEAAFLRGDATVKLNDSYSVAFNDKHAGMVQFRSDDRGRWRQVKRVGGPAGPARASKLLRVTGSSSDDSDDDSSGSWPVTDSDDDYEDVGSSDEDWAGSSESDRGKKKKKAAKKTKKGTK
jgi:hypothetical protein